MEEIVNRVAKSPLVSIDLEEYLHEGEVVILDVKPMLYQEMVLREKDFRSYIKNHDWSVYQGKNVGIVCTADAIVPTWAYMLLTAQLHHFANVVIYGDEMEVEKALIDQAVKKCLSSHELEEKKVVIKGCGSIKNVAFAYTLITQALLPLVSSIMYGEPCSTVPIYKKKKGE